MTVIDLLTKFLHRRIRLANVRRRGSDRSCYELVPPRQSTLQRFNELYKVFLIIDDATALSSRERKFVIDLLIFPLQCLLIL